MAIMAGRDALPPQRQQPKTAGANSKLDKTWGQGHLVWNNRKRMPDQKRTWKNRPFL
jgi:hypothetical protein